MKLVITAVVASVVASVVALSAAAPAQEPEPSPRARDARALKLDVLFQRFAGDRLVASQPFTLSLIGDDRPSRARVGIQVPLPDDDKDARTRYQHVGAAVDCHARAQDDDRFSVECVFEQTSAFSPDAKAEAGLGPEPLPAPPVLRLFRADARMLLKDGQSGQSTSAGDPLSGEVLKLGLALTVVK